MPAGSCHSASSVGGARPEIVERSLSGRFEPSNAPKLRLQIRGFRQSSDNAKFEP
jgi:hypothetical protein